MVLPMSRLSIFVDGNNMFYAQQKNGWFFDPRRVLEYFKNEQPETTLINAFWYTGLKDPQDQRGFRDALISLGYTVRTKILKEYYDDVSGRYSPTAPTAPASVGVAMPKKILPRTAKINKIGGRTALMTFLSNLVPVRISTLAGISGTLSG